jgi:hypothetical protein
MKRSEFTPYENIPPDAREISHGAYLPDADEILDRRRQLDRDGHMGHTGNWQPGRKLGLPIDREDSD